VTVVLPEMLFLQFLLHRKLDIDKHSDKTLWRVRFHAEHIMI